MTKIVVDTSVIVSALIDKAGPSREILRRCLTGEYKPVISATLFMEYQDMYQRPKVPKICPLESLEIKDLLNAFYSVCGWIQIHYLWRPKLKGENDNFLVELAMASNARFIVTNNIRDLSGAELAFDGLLKVVKPEQLLRGK